jgi:hypothetical protein
MMALTLQALQPMLEALKTGNVKNLNIAIKALNTQIEQPAITRTLYYKGEGYGQYLYRIDTLEENQTEGKTIIYTERGQGTPYPTSKAPPIETYKERTVQKTLATVHINEDAHYKIQAALKDPAIQTKVFEALFSTPIKNHMGMINAFCTAMEYDQQAIKKFCSEAIVYLQTVKQDPDAAQQLYNQERTVHTSLEKDWQKLNRVIALVDWLKDKECVEIDKEGRIQFKPNLSHHAVRDLKNFLEGKSYTEMVTAKNEMKHKGGAQFLAEHYPKDQGSFDTLKEVSIIDDNIRIQLDEKKSNSSLFTQAGRGMKELAYSYVPGTKRVGPSTTELMTKWDILQTNQYDSLRAEPGTTGIRNRY